MKDKRNLHAKLQELCDCYATTDPLKEMSELKKDEDRDVAALKWLALAALHGINSNAKKITINKSDNGNISVISEYRVAELPSPGIQIGKKIIDAVRAITHLEGEKGKTTLVLGIRNDSLEINVALKKENDNESITLKFPE